MFYGNELSAPRAAHLEERTVEKRRGALARVEKTMAKRNDRGKNRVSVKWTFCGVECSATPRRLEYDILARVIFCRSSRRHGVQQRFGEGCDGATDWALPPDIEFRGCGGARGTSARRRMLLIWDFISSIVQRLDAFCFVAMHVCLFYSGMLLTNQCFMMLGVAAS